jgi:hypothetical protein
MVVNCVQVVSLAKAEADEVIKMQQEKIEVEQEIRFTKVSAGTLTMWKYLREGPAWLHGDELMALTQYKAKMTALQEEREKAALAEVDSAEFTSIRAPDHALIKSGKFGPDIEEFTMPLPVTFPSRAGQQKFALEPVLTLHEKVVKKLQVEKLPSTLEDVKVKIYSRFSMVAQNVVLF